jgi:hypothetical protein
MGGDLAGLDSVERVGQLTSKNNLVCSATIWVGRRIASLEMLPGYRGKFPGKGGVKGSKV